MCFSAEASFTVSAVLGVIGIATLKQAKKPGYLLVALLPLLFGIQQFLEGIVWIHMEDGFIRTYVSEAAVSLYLFFAWILWPVYIPLAFLIPETVNWKRSLFGIILMMGLFILFMDVKYLLSHTVTPTIQGYSLDYGYSPLSTNMAYGLIVLIPIFLSSIPGMWIFGAWLLGSFIISQMIYAWAFTSVWCFFSAAISIVLYKILKENATRKELI
jgi:hypothetical protein